MQVNRCFNCMAELHHTAVCPLCGYDMAAGQKLPYALAPGTVLHGKYLMGRVLGQGGFGITYVGFDLALEIKVAIKECYISHQCLRNTATSTEVLWVSRDKGAEDYRNVFLREARKMAKIRDIPYLTRVLDIFHENETAYIVMDFVEGETLAARIQRQNAPLAWEQALPIFQKVLHAMELVHQRGMIHRDLSPDNLMLEPDGNVRILDLGAAKDLNQGTGASSMVVAKNGFTPLEQYGQRGSSDARSDVYALAATMFFSLTKTLPSSPIDRLQEDRLELSLLREQGVPEYAVEAIVSGLALWQRDRPPSMAAFAALLKPPAAKPSPTPTEESPAEKPPPAPMEEPSKEEPPIPAEEPVPAPAEEPGSAADVLPKEEKTPRLPLWKRLAVTCGLLLVVILGIQLPVIQQLLHPAHLTYTLREDGCAVITGLDGTAGDLQIPATLDGHYVAAIGRGAFSGRTDLTSVTVAEGVDEIQATAFLNCTSLTTATLPNHLKSIESWAFAGCSSLTEVTLPEELVTLGSYAFLNCSSLSAIALPETLRDLGLAAFAGCTALPSVTLPDSLSDIQYSTFYGCSSLSSVELPAALVTIGSDAFYNCASLSSVELPAGLETIGSNAFYGCALTEVTLPQGCSHYNSFDADVEILAPESEPQPPALTYQVEEDGTVTITGVTGDVSGALSIPEAIDGCPVTTLGNRALKGLTGLTSVELPDSLTVIGSNAFKGCTGLKSITIPGSVTIIEDFAFGGCTALSQLSLSEGLKTIDYGAFYNCTSLVTLELPQGLEYIGLSAFRCCGIQSVTIPAGCFSFQDSFERSVTVTKEN